MSILISPFLKKALIADAVLSGAAALLMAFGAELLAGLLGLPEQLLLWAGGALLPFVMLLLLTARRESAPKLLLASIVVINILWVLASIILLIGGLVSPNALGYAFVIAQALAVGLFAELQIVGLRQSPASA